MHRIGMRVWVVATVIATLVLPAAGSIAGDLDDKKRQLEELQDRIQAREAAARTVKEEAQAINQNMVDLRNELAELAEDIAKVESQVRTAQARIDATQKRIDKIKDLATEQAVQLYKSGAIETLDALLNARSLTELDDRVEMLGVAAQENTGHLVEYGRLKMEIQAQHEVLFARERELEAVERNREEVLATLNEQHEKLQVKLAEIEAALDEDHHHEELLASDIRKIESEILEKQTLHSVAILGKSQAGYIWPLNGAITSYYGPRWGRMHTGIDIDGTTGQPIVASNSGRVIVAGPYYGYGNAVIIDHGGGVSTLYAHLSAFDVSNGQDVSQGQIVGRVGCTGSCTGDHLHFEVRVNGSPVNPLDYLP